MKESNNRRFTDDSCRSYGAVLQLMGGMNQAKIASIRVLYLEYFRIVSARDSFKSGEEGDRNHSLLSLSVVHIPLALYLSLDLTASMHLSTYPSDVRAADVFRVSQSPRDWSTHCNRRSAA